MSRFTVRVSGLDHITRNLDMSRLAGAAARSWLNRSANLIAERARSQAPRDTGRLIGSIRAHQTRIAWPYAFGVVAGARHARFVHGGLAGSETGDRTRPHWPPIPAIRAWAERHGIPPFLVARAISQRGTPIIRFLTIAMREARPRLDQFLGDAARQVERQWRS